jgi:hypothetical protein
MKFFLSLIMSLGVIFLSFTTSGEAMEGLKATFQPLTIGQFIEVCDKKVEFPAWEEEMVWSAACVSHSMDEVFTYLKEQATPDDARLLRELDTLFYHGILPIKHECTNYIIEVQDKQEHEGAGLPAGAY